MASILQPTAIPVDPEDRELIPQDNPIAAYVSINAARMHGQPVFRGTRVPIQNLFDHLRAGDSFEKFLAGFPNVTRDQIVAVIDLASRGLIESLPRA